MIRVVCTIIISVQLCSCTTTGRHNSNSLKATETTDVLRDEMPWSFQGEEGKRMLLDVWDIRTTLKYQHIVDSLPSFYEALINRYTTVFGELPYPDRKMDVYLFATESQWQSQLATILGDEAEHWYQLKSGGVTIDGTAVLYHLDRRGRSRVTLRIAAHEGWHQYAEAVFAKCLPTWLDEGIGTWMEGFRIRRGEVQFMPASNWDRLTTLRAILYANRLAPLSELMQSDPSTLLSSGRTTLLGYYAQLWGLVSFIIEFEDGKYMPSLQSLLQEAVAGTIRKPRHGWLMYFTADPIQFEDEYKKWVAQYVRPNGQWR